MKTIFLMMFMALSLQLFAVETPSLWKEYQFQVSYQKKSIDNENDNQEDKRSPASSQNEKEDDISAPLQKVNNHKFQNIQSQSREVANEFEKENDSNVHFWKLESPFENVENRPIE